jgi:hypothetical protein
MARKTTARKRKATKPRKAAQATATAAVDESALRKSLGEAIANRAFTQWVRQKSRAKSSAPTDKNAELIAGALEPLAKAGKLRISRGGYLVKRGRGRVIVTPAGSG